MLTVSDVKKVIQEILSPDIKDIKGDIREVKVEIRRLDEKIDAKFNSLQNEMASFRGEVDTKIDSLKNIMISEIRRLEDKTDSVDDKIDIALQIRERLASLESKVATLAMGH